MNNHNNSTWDICGQDKIVDFLTTAVSNGKVSHAYLFSGPAHIGKYSLAKEFAAAILCAKGINACRECFNCKQLKNNSHPDIYTVERMIDEKTEKLKKDITVEQIRDLKNRLQQSSFLNGYKIAIISEAQSINNNAANALLKILEEPSPKTIIILITDDLKKMSATVISRCQVLKFLPVKTKEIEKYLQSKGATPSESSKLARLAIGRPGIALSFLQDKDLLGSFNQDVRSFFSMVDSNIDKRFKDIEKIIDWDKDESLNLKKLNVLLDNWQLVIRDFLLIKTENDFLISNGDFGEAFNSHKRYFSAEKIINVMKNINYARLLGRQNINSKSILENLILSL